MKRRQFSQAALASMALSAATVSAQTAPYQEGIEYVSLDKRVPTEAGKGKIEVIEFFWYSCPHCNAFEPRFASWVKALPKDVEVKRVPVRFRDDFEPQQRMYYVLEALDKVEALHGKLFQAIHVEKQNLGSAEALAQWADKNGIPKAKFVELYNAFGVVTKAKRAHQLQEAFKVQGVPALGIGGRFYTDGSLSGSMERALQITDYLISEIRKGR
jgi:thiol:disulfide interchange protein DsbA